MRVFDRSHARDVARVLSSAVTCLMLSACGGGGGDTDGPVTPTPVTPTVSLSTANVELAGLSSTAAISAVATPASATVSWRSENSAIASVAGSGASATLTAVSAGSTTIVVTATVGSNTAEARATVRVTPVVRALVITPATPGVTRGQTVRLSTTPTADAGADVRVQWTSADPAKATIDTTGLVTAIAPGTVTVTARSAAFPAVSATTVVTVNDVPKVRAISLAPTTDSALVGVSRTFTPTITADSGVARTLLWRSSSPAVATISQSGVATTVALGTTTITALSTVDTTIRASATLFVRAPAVRSISATLRATTFLTSDTATLVPTIVADPGADQRVTYASSNTAVATINAAGVVQTVGPGTTALAVASVSSPSVSASVNITVSVPAAPTRWVETSDGQRGDLSTLAALSIIRSRVNGDMYAVGIGGAIAERSANAWLRVSSPTTKDLVGLGVTTTEAWAVGKGGTIVRRTPSGWVLESSGTTRDLSSVAMRDDGTGVAGGSGIVLERIGGVWQTIRSTSSTESPVVAAAPTGRAAWASSNFDPSFPEKSVVQWNGSAWTPLPRASPLGGSSFDVARLLALSNGELLTSGLDQFRAFVSRWTGATWVREYTGSETVAGAFFTFNVCTDGSLIGESIDGSMRQRVAGTWTVIAQPSGDLRPAGNFGCRSPSSWVVGSQQVSWRITGSQWIAEAYSIALSKLGVGGAAAAWASASGGGTALAYDGTTWTALPIRAPSFANIGGGPAFAVLPSGAVTVFTDDFVGTRTGGVFSWLSRLLIDRDAWAVNANEAWVAGSARASVASGLERRVGSTATDMMPASLRNADFTAVHGAGSVVMAVGLSFNATSTYLATRWNGSALVIDTLPTSTSWSSADIAVSSATDAMIVSSVRSARFNGTTWVRLPDVPASLVTVAGRNGEYYAFSSDRGVYFFDGTRWRLIGTTTQVIGRARMNATGAIAVGENGTIVYGQPSAAGISGVVRRRR